MDSFGPILGAVASALAIFAAALAAWRWNRARRQRNRLGQTVAGLQAAASTLRSTVVQIDHRMSDGVGWAGWDIWPDDLGLHITTLDELILNAEATAARARGMAVEPGLERLRADVEQCALLLRLGAEVYRSGTIANYRAIEGKPVPPGHGGRDVTAAVHPDNENDVRDVSREFTRLVRSCLYQVRSDDAARSYEAEWPATRAEILAADPDWNIRDFPPHTDLAPPLSDW